MVSHRESFLSSVKSALIKHLHLFDFDGTICFSEGFDEEKLVDPVVNKVIVRQMSDLLEAGEEVAILSSRKNSGIIKNFIEREAGLFMDVPIHAIGDPDEAAKGEYIKRNFNDYDIVTLHDDNTSYLQNATEILKDSGIEFIPVVVKDERKVRPVKKDAAKSVKAVSEDIIAKTCTNYREATKDMSVDEFASFWDLIGTESDFYDQVDEKIRELLMSGDSFYDTWYSKLMDNEKHAVIICDISFDSVVDFLVERDTVLFLHEGEDVFSDSVFMDVLNLGMDSYYVSLEFSSHGFLFEDGSTLDINDDHRVIDINTWFPENIVTLHISQRDLNVRLNTTTTSLQFEYLDSLLYEKSIENVYYDVYQGNAMVGHGDIDLRQDFDELDWRKLVKKRNAARKNTGASDRFRYFNNEDVKKYAPETLKSNIFKMFSGDQLNDILYVLEELKEVGAEIDDNGLVTVYHHTSEENADKILKTGEMIGKEDNLFFTTKKDGQASGYGPAVVSFKIPIEYLELDDIFTDEAHVTFAGVPNKGVNVKPFLPVRASFYGDVSVRLKSPNKESFKFVEDLFDKISIYNTGMSRGISLVYHDGGENPDPLIKDFFFDGDGNHFCRVKKAENKEIILELSLPAYSECLESLIAHLLSGVSFVIDCEDSGMVEYYGDKPPLTESVVTFKSVKAFEDSELISRAKQYDTFEEFLKTFGDPVFHGTNAEFVDFDVQKAGTKGNSVKFSNSAVYVSPNESFASKYGSHILKVYIDPNAKFVDYDDIKYLPGFYKWLDSKIKSNPDYDRLNAKEDFAFYKKYDFISYGENEFVVFNPSILKTEASLKNIWDKAHSMSVSSSVPFTTVFYDSMVAFLKELFDINVEVKYGNTKKDLFGFMPLSFDSGVSSVTIDTSGSLKYVLKSIIHELTHIKQVQYGQLATDGISILWEGVPVISVNQYNSLKRSDWAVYSELPFEKEAFANSEELFNLYVSSPYFKDLANSEDTSVSYVAKTGFNVSSSKDGLGIEGLIGPVYHGTPEKFDSFDVGKAGTSTDSGMYGVGFYFSSDYDFASTYSVRGDKTGEVKEVYLDLKNPLILNNRSDIPKIAVPSETMEDLRNSDKNYSKLFTKFLRDNGYDGVIENISGKPQYVVLDASQIIQAPLKTVASSTDFNSLQMLIVDLAQEVLDSWQPDEDGIDDDFGGGGVCDEINRHIQSVLVDAGFEVYEGGQEGSDHAFTYAVKDGKAFYVDIPPYVYETGSGYSWKKLEGVRLKPSDVVINEISLDDLNDIVDSEDRITSSFSGSFIAYHGSYSDFDTFTQVTKAGVDSFATTQPLFFTRQYKYAYQNYANAKGGIVYKCLLSPKKMFMVTDDLAEDIGKIGWWDRLTEVGESLMLWLTSELSDDDKVEDIFMSVVKRDYDTMESDLIIRWIKNEGYDSFEVIEYGDVNVSVLDTSIIKILEKIDPSKVAASVPFSALTVGEYSGELRDLAHGIKDGNQEDIDTSGEMMSNIIPDGSVLVPVPSRGGDATTTLKLAKAIVKHSPSCSIKDILKGASRRSLYDLKKESKTLSEEEFGFFLTEELPKDLVVYLIDNVIASGSTGLAASKVVPNSVLVALADDSGVAKKSVYYTNLFKNVASVDTDTEYIKAAESGSRDIRSAKDLENYMKVSASGIYGLILVSPATVVDWVNGVKDLHFEEGVKWLFDKYPDKELTLEVCNYLRNLYVKITGENIKSITPVWEQSICPRYVEEVGKVFLGTQDNIWNKDGNVITASKASDDLLSLFDLMGGVAENDYKEELPSWHGKEPFEMTEEEYRAYQKYIEPVDHDTAQVMSDMLNELFEAVGSDPMGGYVLTSRLFDGCLTVTAWKYSKYVDSFLICCVGDTQEGDMLKNWGSFLAWIKFGMSEGFENKPGLKDYIDPFSGDVLIVKAKKNKNWEEYSDDVTAPLSQKYGISFGKDKDGYFARTHRARSDSFESVDKIPVSQLKFIGTTGSVKASAEEDSQRREEAHQYNLQILDKIQSKEYVLDKDYNDFSITVKSEPSLKIKQSDNYSGYLNENTNTIHININSRDESESDFIRSVLYDRKVWENIFHEYIHYSDLLRMGRLNYTHPQKGVEKYYNQPVEYNAYYQQAMMYVDKMLNNMSAGERADVLSSFDKFYNLLNMDEVFQKNMSDETQKKLLKRVYKSFSSVQSGKKVKASESWAIPPQLEGFYDLTGDASNAPNWKAQVLVGNSGDTPIGTYEDIYYVLVDLDSNYIIPVARSDEHQLGTDMLYDLYDKYKLPQGRYVPVAVRGTNYLQNRNDENKVMTLEAIKKWVSYGGNKVMIEDQTPDGAVKIDSDTFMELGKVEPYKGSLSASGRYIVDTFNYLSDTLNKIYKAYRKEPLIKKFNSTALTLLQWLRDTFVFELTPLMKNIDKGIAQIMASGDDDYSAAETVIFSHGGIKNAMHNKLRAIEKDPKDYDKNNYQMVFGDLTVAKKEFDMVDPGINVAGSTKHRVNIVHVLNYIEFISDNVTVSDFVAENVPEGSIVLGLYKIPISMLHPTENLDTKDLDNVRGMVAALERGEDLKPVSVLFNSETGYFDIFDGHHRYMAYSELEKDMPCIVVAEPESFGNGPVTEGVNMKDQMSKGKEVEKEHDSTYIWIQDYYKEHGEFPSIEKVRESIAKDHILEIDNYYDLLKQMEEKAIKASVEPGPVDEVNNREWYHGNRGLDFPLDYPPVYFSSSSEVAAKFADAGKYTMVVDGEVFLNIDSEQAQYIVEVFEPTYEPDDIVSWGDLLNSGYDEKDVAELRKLLSDMWGLVDVKTFALVLKSVYQSNFYVAKINVKSVKVVDYQGRVWGTTDTFLDVDAKNAFEEGYDCFLGKNVQEGGIAFEGDFPVADTLVVFKKEVVSSFIASEPK